MYVYIYIYSTLVITTLYIVYIETTLYIYIYIETALYTIRFVSSLGADRGGNDHSKS